MKKLSLIAALVVAAIAFAGRPGTVDSAGFRSYWARGADSDGSADDGTIAPTAAGGSVAFAPEVSIPTLMHLRERFGGSFRVRYEESYLAQYGPRARVEAPWLQIIPGGRGHVYAWDDRRLAASTNTSGVTAKKLKAQVDPEKCWGCGLDWFPRTDPVVIMLVTDGERCILAHEHRYQNKMYSTLAGFLEPGEDIERLQATGSAYHMEERSL